MQAFDPTNTPGGSAIPFGHLNFTLIGDPMNPNGGLLERFVGLTLPSGGIDFCGATPANSFPAEVFTLEYDGYADFPNTQSISCRTSTDFWAADLCTAPIRLSCGHSLIPRLHCQRRAPPRPSTTYLVQPDLRVLVELGYGSTTQGWSTGLANVPTPFAVIPPVSPITVADALATGTQQGIARWRTTRTLGSAGIPSLQTFHCPACRAR